MEYYSEELVTNKIGRKYWVFKEDPFYKDRIANMGPYQKKNLLELRRLVPKPRTVLDVGMNIGMNSIEYGTWAKKVVGFEPGPQTWDLAVRNIELAKKQRDDDFITGWWRDPSRPTGWASCVVSGEVTTMNCGIGDRHGQLDILVKKNRSVYTHIDNGDTVLDLSRNHIERVSVDIYTLDELEFTEVDIIKIDTEGYEFPVIKGAERTITTQKPIVQLEMKEGFPERFGATCQDIYDWFLARDYVPTMGAGKPTGPIWKNIPKQLERFFIPRGKFDLPDCLIFDN